MLKNSLELSHFLMSQVVSEGDIVVDATIGNGHDTLFLAELVGNAGKVYGFDIQELAIQRTTERLKKNDALAQVELYEAGHENLKQIIPDSPTVSAAIFNLGYLPRGDKSIVTKAETTLISIESLMSRLRDGGLILLVIYYGHNGGEDEREKIIHFSKQLPQALYEVAHYEFLNQVNSPPELIVIEKKDSK